MKKRSVVLGMMSEACMKGRIVLEALKNDEDMVRCEQLIVKMERIEADMKAYSEELERLMPK